MGRTLGENGEHQTGQTDHFCVGSEPQEKDRKRGQHVRQGSPPVFERQGGSGDAVVQPGAGPSCVQRDSGFRHTGNTRCRRSCKWRKGKEGARAPAGLHGQKNSKPSRDETSGETNQIGHRGSEMSRMWQNIPKPKQVWGSIIRCSTASTRYNGRKKAAI